MLVVNWFQPNSLRRSPTQGTTDDGRPVQYQQYMPVPYNLEIELAIMSKTQDDGLQILEQILPSFHPAMNVSIEVIDTTKEERDIAIVLNGVGYQDDYEGDFTERRTLIWTLNFTVKTYLFGPIDAIRDIRKVNWTIALTSNSAQQNFAILLRLSPRTHHQSPETRLTHRPITIRSWRLMKTSTLVTTHSSGWVTINVCF